MFLGRAILPLPFRPGVVVFRRLCWETQCRNALLIWIVAGQGLTMVAVGSGGAQQDINRNTVANSCQAKANKLTSSPPLFR